MNDTTAARAHGPPGDRLPQEDRWSGRLLFWTAILILANIMADEAISAPALVMPQMLEYFGTDQYALLSTSAMLAGAIWSPLLGKSADIYGKRRMLVVTLAVACAGGLICLVATNVGVFLVGRFLQGAALASVFMTVAFVRQLCAPRVAMPMIGIVTSGSAIVGVIEPFLLNPIIDRFGHQGVFVVSTLLAAVAALGVRVFLPETPARPGGRIDVRGALLLGGGLVAVLGYVVLGPDFGWLSGGMIVVLAAGVAALTSWVRVALRVENPIVEIRILDRPLVLTLLAVVLAAGSYRSIVQLTSLVAPVPPDRGLGYGLGGDALAVMMSMFALGVMVGGTFAGWLATRIGPRKTLFGGIASGTIATIVMFAGVSMLGLAIACAVVLGISAGAISSSGFNLATSLVPPERYGMVSGLVFIVLSVGSVVANVAGGAVLRATDTMVNGVAVNSAAGVDLYVLMATTLFALALVPVIMLLRERRPAPVDVDVSQDASLTTAR